jgi:hypothetical protein
MVSSIGLARSVFIYVICVVVAVVLGFMVTTPYATSSLAVFGLLGMVLAFPLLMKWHHALLILTWSASITLFFLPGQPTFGMLMALLSFSIAVLDYSMGRKRPFIPVPALTWPLLFLAAVVLVTAGTTGGIGFRVFGSGVYGGKRYFFLLLAILSYFAFTAQPIPRPRAMFLASGFFLSALTSMVSNVAYLVGPGAYFLFLLFPTENTFGSIRTGSELFVRFIGVSWAAMAVCQWLLLRYGVRGILDLTRPWRLVLFLSTLAASTLGGFRLVLLVLVSIFAVQFFLEGLGRTRFLPALLLAGVLTFTLAVPFADRLPLSVQRSLTFLPLRLDRVALADAQASVDWRLDMWHILWREVPRYLWLGKGYAMSPSDQYLAEEGARRGIYQNIEPAMIAGNYHSGPLTVLISFGVWGAVAILWFSWAALRVLHRNYKHGDPELRTINTFLFALMITRLGTFYTVYGDLSTDMLNFAAILGLSVSLNGGVCGPRAATEEVEVAEPALA